MKLIIVLSFLTSVLAVKFKRVPLPQSTPLEVTVESVGNSVLKASITNTGSETLRLLRAGSILDDRAIERAEIYSGCKSTPAFRHSMAGCWHPFQWDFG